MSCFPWSKLATRLPEHWDRLPVKLIPGRTAPVNSTKLSGASTNSKNAGISPYSVSPVVAQTAAVATAEPMAQLMTTMATISPNTPMLAAGTIIPPNATASGASTFARPSASYGGNDIKQMLAMGDDVVRSNIAGHEATVGVLSQILEAVLNIELDGATLSKAIDSYRRKEAVCRG